MVRLLGCRSILEVTGLSLEQACDAFGEYWCCTYAPKMYEVFVKKFSNARDMILGMDAVHVTVTKTVPNAHPPRFKYTWTDDKTLNIEYISERGLVDVYVGLVRGVGKFFKEPLQVSKVDKSNVKVVFN